jgi:RNA polymerase-interacting CarD/CdnL/TRCF family regulator
MVKISEQENPAIYHLFLKMKMDTKISTKKFYKKFRKIFIKEVPINNSNDKTQANDFSKLKSQNKFNA